MRIVFAGTPKFAVKSLSVLNQSEHKVVAVYCQPDRPKGRGKVLTACPVKIFAEENNLLVIQPEDFKDKQSQTQLALLNPDVMVVAAYGQILPKAVLEIPKLGCLNIHASLLPRWRGAAPIERAILEGDRETGISIMKMNEGLDTGDIMLVKKGMTFRDAHDIVGKVVSYGINENKDLSELSLKELKVFKSSIENDVFDAISLEGSLNARNHLGGTSPKQVSLAIKAGRKSIK